ncbi:hypothetical protein HDV02_003515, partial [Globomyces sp. JEL0801]
MKFTFLLGIVFGKKDPDSELKLSNWELKLSNWSNHFINQGNFIGTSAYSATFFKLTDDNQSIINFQNGSCYDLNGNIKSSQNNQTLYRWASVSKMYATTALFQLIENGLVNTYDLVADHLPWLANRLQNHHLTVHDLLHHTVGLDENVLENYAPFPARNVSLKSVVEEMWTEFILPPGGAPSYSNLGMTILGSLIEEKAKLNLGDYLKKHVYEPLNITHNGFHYEIDQQGKMKDLCYCEDSNQFEPYDVLNYSSGGIISTTDDVVKFFIALLRNGHSLFKKKSTSDKFREAPDYAKYFGPIGYRNGWKVEIYKGVEMFTKGGNLEGFQSKAWIIPKFNEGGVFISTSTYEHRLRDKAIQIYMDLVHPDLKHDVKTLPPIPYTENLKDITVKIAGTYSNLRSTYAGVSRILDLPAEESMTVTVNTTIGSLYLLNGGQLVNYVPVKVDEDQPDNIMVYQAVIAGKLQTLVANFDAPIKYSSSSVSFIVLNGSKTLIPVGFLDQPSICYLMLTFELLSIVIAGLLAFYSIKYFRGNVGHGNYQAIPDGDTLAELEETQDRISDSISYGSLLWTTINILQLLNIIFGLVYLVTGSFFIEMFTINSNQTNPITLLTIFVSSNIMYSIGALLLALCIPTYFVLKHSNEK